MVVVGKVVMVGEMVAVGAPNLASQRLLCRPPSVPNYCKLTWLQHQEKEGVSASSQYHKMINTCDYQQGCDV